MKRICAIFVLSIFFSSAFFAQNRVGFFSAVSSSDDEATINLTEELYYSKASLISDINVVDFRNRTFSKDNLQNYSEINYAFFPEIQEDGTGWMCTFHGINVNTKQEYSTQKRYDSYYKILMDAKNELESFFQAMHSPNSSGNSDSSSVSVASINLDMLSGTWQGESYIDKIVILRGGRGFVIYKNGASMNISVAVANGKLTATQIGSTNASFFPDVSKDLVLSMGHTEPIVWNFVIKNPSTLEGTKYTLQEVNTTAEFTNIPVIWRKI